MKLVALMVILLGACDVATPRGDAAVIIPPDEDTEMCDRPPEPIDLLGEPCVSEPFPVNTVCHGRTGWCIENVCRPMCSGGCVACASGRKLLSPAGACYCAP